MQISDAVPFDGYKLIDTSAQINESFKDEMEKSHGAIIGVVEGKHFCPGGTSRNHRWYPPELWLAVGQNEAVQARLKRNGIVGRVGHEPEITDEDIGEGNYSHFTKDIDWKTGFARSFIVDTPMGRNLLTALRARIGLYVSSRATGDYNGKTESTSVLYLNTAHTSRLATFNERTTYSSTRKASQSNMRNELINFNNALETFKNAQDQLLPLDEGAYGLQFLVQTNRPNTYEKWTNAAKNVYDRYAEIRLAAFNAADNVMTYSEQLPFSNSTKTYGTYYNDLMNRYNSLAGIFNGNIGPYTSKLQSYCNSSADKVRTSAISSAITLIHEEIEGYRKTLENAKNALSSAVTELNNVLTAVKSGGTLQNAKSSWNSAADNVKDTSMGKQDKSEISSLSTYLNETDVQKMITRLNNIIGNLETMITQVEATIR